VQAFFKRKSNLAIGGFVESYLYMMNIFTSKFIYKSVCCDIYKGKYMVQHFEGFSYFYTIFVLLGSEILYYRVLQMPR